MKSVADNFEEKLSRNILGILMDELKRMEGESIILGVARKDGTQPWQNLHLKAVKSC